MVTPPESALLLCPTSWGAVFLLRGLAALGAAAALHLGLAWKWHSCPTVSSEHDPQRVCGCPPAELGGLEDERYFLFSEMLCGDLQPGTLCGGGHWKPGGRCKLPFSTPKGFSFPYPQCCVSPWLWERTDTGPDTVGTGLKPARMSFSIRLLTALFCNFATSVWG